MTHDEWDYRLRERGDYWDAKWRRADGLPETAVAHGCVAEAMDFVDRTATGGELIRIDYRDGETVYTTGAKFDPDEM